MATLGENIAVCPFVVVADSREQAPYSFEGLELTGRDRGKRAVVRIERKALNAGDYSIVGFEDRIAVERKSLIDLYGTLAGGYERFKRELDRLAKLDFAAVVIEADLRELWRPSEFHPGWRSNMNPRSIEGMIVSFSLDYPGIHWWTCGSRNAAMIRTFGVLSMYWRKMQHEAQ